MIDPKRMKSRRQQLRLTQKTASAKVGMSKSHWADIEQGRMPSPRLNTCERIATALGCTVSDLVR